jgi:hypothetical protein
VFSVVARVTYLGDGGGIISKGPGGLYVRVGSGGQVELLRCNEQILATSSVVLESGRTYTIAANQNGSTAPADFDLFINGTKDTAAKKRTPSGTTRNTLVPLSIGCNTHYSDPAGTKTFNEYLNARADEVALFNRPLTNTEHLEVHRAAAATRIGVGQAVATSEALGASAITRLVSVGRGQAASEALRIVALKATRIEFSAYTEELVAIPTATPIDPGQGWSWVLCHSNGQPYPGAHVARGRRLVFTRNQAAEARLTLSLHDEAAIQLFADLANGIPQLRVYRTGQLVFCGHMEPISGESATGEQAYVNLVFKDALAILQHRYTPADKAHPANNHTKQDAGLIARALIDYTNTAHSDTTILTGAGWVEKSKVRDRAYENKSIGEAIRELTEVQDGFDVIPVYLDPRTNDGKTMRLSPAPFHVTNFKPDPALAPLPWDHFELGDTVRWNVTDGAMRQQLKPRVETFEVGLDDSDNIDDLLVGIDPGSAGSFITPANTARRYVSQQRDLLRRLSALER